MFRFQGNLMKRFGEFVNESFFGNSYDKYKRKVLDALSSVGILIGEDKMKPAEEWIRDYYADKMSPYQCASALRDELKKPSSDKMNEAFEKFASEIIDSAPALQKKRALKRMTSMTIHQKNVFDEILLQLSLKKNKSAKEIAESHGYDIMRLIQDGLLSKEQIIERIGWQILGNSEKMSVKEALEIIHESGKEVDDSKTMDWMEQAKKELIKIGYGPLCAEDYVSGEWKAEFVQSFKDGYTPEEAAASFDQFMREQEHDESY